MPEQKDSFKEDKESSLINLCHPEYTEKLTTYRKFRYIEEGGSALKTQYLTKFSNRESNDDFNARVKLSYTPSHAKAAVIDIKNSIYQRLADVTREGGSVNWKNAISGKKSGVDKKGSSLEKFIGTEILHELVFMGKVGVMVDMEILPDTASRRDVADKHPYLYIYHAEEIQSWSYDDNQKLTSVLLKNSGYKIDDRTGLTFSTQETYLLLKKVEDWVEVEEYDSDGTQINETKTLQLDEIPFLIFELSQALLLDVADHEIALMNLASADMSYCFYANFPFYTEQYQPSADIYARQAVQTPDEDGTVGYSGTSAAEKVSKDKEIRTGPQKGRRYPKGLERPEFIAPPTEPLLASLKKQDQIRQEIRELVNLSVTNLEPRRVSADLKNLEERSLEAGLSYIGLELLYAEQRIAELWAKYEGNSADVKITYPRTYSLKSDDERVQEAKSLEERVSKTPSSTLQKELSKEVATILVGNRVDVEVLNKIHAEIDNATIIETDPTTIIADHEAGLVGDETASKIRGYPDGEVDKARKDQSERLARIQAAQGDDTARGVPDAGMDPKASEKEKVNKPKRGEQVAPTGGDK